MLRFCGFDLELLVDDVLSREDWPSVCCARDTEGCSWLIVQTDDDPENLEWMCARSSERAMGAVREGRASPEDLLRHSVTGTVELVAVEHGRAVPDRCLLGVGVTPHLDRHRVRRGAFPDGAADQGGVNGVDARSALSDTPSFSFA